MVQAEKDPLNDALRNDVLISKEDLAKLGIADGDAIVLENDLGAFRGRARAARILPGNLQAHWPEVNPLIPADRVDPLGLVPDYNALVTVRKA